MDPLKKGGGPGLPLHEFEDVLKDAYDGDVQPGVLAGGFLRNLEVEYFGPESPLSVGDYGPERRRQEDLGDTMARLHEDRRKYRRAPITEILYTMSKKCIKNEDYELELSDTAEIGLYHSISGETAIEVRNGETPKKVQLGHLEEGGEQGSLLGRPDTQRYEDAVYAIERMLEDFSIDVRVTLGRGGQIRPEEGARQD